MIFNDITLDDKSLIEQFVKPWNEEIGCSDLSFANMFIWGYGGKIQFAIEDDFLYIKFNFPDVPNYFWTPIPKKNTQFDYKEAVYKALSFLEENGYEPTLRSVWLPFKVMIENECNELFINDLELTHDYVYLAESLISLKGKKLHSKRNHINKFIHSNVSFKYKKLDDTMIDDCLKIYEGWILNKDTDDDSLEDERLSVKMALTNMDKLSLEGGCIYIEGKLEAFTVGERITSDMHLIHIEKANYDIKGLYPMINQQHALYECSDVLYINREEDMGLIGMRKAKRSYAPVKMTEKFIVSKKPLDEIENLWGEEKEVAHLEEVVQF